MFQLIIASELPPLFLPFATILLQVLHENLFVGLALVDDAVDGAPVGQTAHITVQRSALSLRL